MFRVLSFRVEAFGSRGLGFRVMTSGDNDSTLLFSPNNRYSRAPKKTGLALQTHLKKLVLDAAKARFWHRGRKNSEWYPIAPNTSTVHTDPQTKRIAKAPITP